MPGNIDSQSNTIRVKLIKQRHGGLGFLVKRRTEKPYVMVADLVAGGIAEASGLMMVGDVVLRINDINLTDMGYENAVEILKAVPIDAPVVLLLRGIDGYCSHLVTTFLENGMPHTIRVSNLIDNSVVSRIKRTFTSHASPSKVRSPNKLCNGNESGGQGEGKSVDGELDDTLGPGEDDQIDSFLRDAKTQTHKGKTVDYNSKVTRVEKVSNVAADGTVLGGGTHGSPKILLNSGKIMSNGPRAISPNKKSIEIFQDKDEITVVVKGDVKVLNNGEELAGHMSVGSTISSTSSSSQGRDSSSCPGSNSLMAVGNRDGEEVARRKTSLVNPQKKFIKLMNVIDGKCTVDILHQKQLEVVPCNAQRCMGSIMFEPNKRQPGEPRPKDELLVHAKDFIDQYYASIKRSNTASHQKRWEEVAASINDSGTYELTFPELTYGAKTAWRNAPRCIGRIQWSKLQVFDARHITTARGMFEALCNHIKYGTNKGNLRSAITVFPHRRQGKNDYRVWNAQMIRYAGYRQPDGTIIGDPAGMEFTEILEKMGWKGKGTAFDILPLVLSAGGNDPEIFEIPSDLILEVVFKHPKYPWFVELGLRWYVLPCVSSLMLDCGGLEFTAVPFNGWFMGSEIGARDLCDVSRYNVTEKVATKMGLDIRKSSSLWRDRALVEVNIAVLYSFQAARVTITDHHAASESFMKHLENEQRLRGGTPADWVWVVPPLSGSITQVFHQEMLLYRLKPSYEYQEDPWRRHVWKKDRGDNKVKSDKPKRKFGFRELARAVKFSAKLMGKALAKRVKCLILYCTETGKSERFALTLCDIFKHGFDAKVMCMEEYDIIDLEHEALVLIVSSTFGNGDPPENGETFGKSLYQMKHPEDTIVGDLKSSMYVRMSSSGSKTTSTSYHLHPEDNLRMETGPLGNIRFCVFGLGSKAYPRFCTYAKFIDAVLGELGGERIMQMGEGDELCGQEESFRNWAEKVFTAALDTFCLTDEINMEEVSGALSSSDTSWTPTKFRTTPLNNEKEADVCQALATIHSKTVMPCEVVERKQLQDESSSRQTILVRLETNGAIELTYQPGDHIGIFPANDPKLVDAILARVHNAPPPDQVIQIEMLQEKTTPLGSLSKWVKFAKMPQCSLKTAFTRYLDLTTPPSQALLKVMVSLTSREEDRARLDHLSKDSSAYEEWKLEHMPTILEVLDEFPSLKVPVTMLLTQLPVLQQRYYSISSSPVAYPGEVHTTIAVVKYRTQGGAGPEHEGVCSNWLNRCEIGEKIPCAIRAAPSFRLPEDATLPIIMVGPGTGIAPFRSFWQQRKVDRDMHKTPQNGKREGWGEMSLYYGCRSSKQDNIFDNELSSLKKGNVLTNYYIALSREPEVPKTYVQDLLGKNAKEVSHAIMKCGGHFYVCGDVSMADDVTRTLERILCVEGGMAADAAKTFVLKLRDANRLHEDIFGVNVTDRSKKEGTGDQTQRIMQYLNSTDKPAKPDSVKEVAQLINDPKTLPGTPKAVPKKVLQ